MPHRLQFALWHAAARFARRRRGAAPPTPAPAIPTDPGISVLIPSRNGRHLLEAQLPRIAAALGDIPSEIIVTDNGSDDATFAWLTAHWPRVLVDVSPAPLSFAAAINRGLARARYSHACLLNNDMLVEPAFFRALRRAFDCVPDLFCATAQIFFPPGVRREETGKAVMAQSNPEDFPIRCDLPVPGEDHTYVLYGSGGCSLYDAARLRALGGVDEAYAPAYVEDLDLGYRAWQRGWPSVFVAGAVVEHRHRATTSRYYQPAELDRILEINYLKFLARAVADPALFRKLWSQAIDRLLLRRDPVLKQAASIARAAAVPPAPKFAESLFLAVANGAVACFPGGAPSAKPHILIGDPLITPPPDLLAAHSEVVVVRAGNPDALRAAQLLKVG